MHRLVSVAFVLVVVVGKFAAGAPGEFSFANVYGSNMVLQRAPQRATIRGYSEEVDQVVLVAFDGVEYEVTTFEDDLGNVSWNASLEPTDAGGPYELTATLGADGTSITLDNILFGDVFFCSGQSNMVHTMSQVDDPGADIGDSANYPDVRFIRSSSVQGDSPAPEAVLAQEWSVPDGVNVGDFSAVCWFFGKRLFESLDVPIGLIQSAIGGTRIECWSAPPVIDECFPNPPADSNRCWNTMVYPFLSYNIFGALWYQGESDTGFREEYTCSIIEMVEDWRTQWNSQTGGNTDPEFSFGQVQLAPYRDPADFDPSGGFPDVRWSQTAELGVTPNQFLPNVYTAVAMDLPDFDSPWGAIHPRYKRQIADRLWVGALQLAYDDTSEGRYRGPYPTNFVLAGNRRMEVDYDNLQVELQFRDLTARSFEMCCNLDGNCTEAESWFEAPILFFGPAEVVLSSPCADNEEAAALRYAWRESPCPNGLENCAIYSTNSTTDTLALPAPPFLVDSSSWNYVDEIIF